jgi:hypothetical protein
MKKLSSYQKLKNEFVRLETDLQKIKNLDYTKSLEGEKPDKEKNKKKPIHISSTIPIINTLYRIRTDISTWRSALQYAEQIQFPVRLELYRLYAEVILDAHLSSMIDLRKDYTLSADYIVTKNGVEVPELTEKIKSKWFYDFTNLALDSIFFGFSLIEFGALDDKKEFSCIELVPRQYVKPELGIVGETPASIIGEIYSELPWSNWCIGVGEKTNLGLLAKAAPVVLWKRGAEMAFAEYSEMFGTPLRVMKTDVYDEETRQSAENMMRNMALSAYAVIGKDDEVDLISDKQAAGVESMFNGLIKTMNNELSKLIVGGTAMSDEKSFVGSAQIHENNFEIICKKDKIMIENIFKYQLVPFLNLHGFGMEGAQIVQAQSSELTLLEQFQIDSELIQLGFVASASYINKKYGTELGEKPVSLPAEPGQKGTMPGQAPDTPVKVKPVDPLIK